MVDDGRDGPKRSRWGEGHTNHPCRVSTEEDSVREVVVGTLFHEDSGTWFFLLLS